MPGSAVYRDVPNGKSDLPEVFILSTLIPPTWRGEVVGWSVMATVLAVNEWAGVLKHPTLSRCGARISYVHDRMVITFVGPFARVTRSIHSFGGNRWRISVEHNVL